MLGAIARARSPAQCGAPAPKPGGSAGEALGAPLGLFGGYGPGISGSLEKGGGGSGGEGFAPFQAPHGEGAPGQGPTGDSAGGVGRRSPGRASPSPPLAEKAEICKVRSCVWGRVVPYSFSSPPP